MAPKGRAAASRGTIDFASLGRELLGRAEWWVEQWFPNGRRAGHEWQVGSLAGEAGKSLSINLRTGVWKDFAGDEGGGDLLSLYAKSRGLQMLAAARELGLVRDDGATPFTRPAAPPAAPPKARTEWEPVLPAPADVPPPIAHTVRGRAQRFWDYRDREGRLLGRVCRFVTSDGGKEVLPTVYARHGRTGAMEWRWLSFPTPRPLYGLDRLRDGRPVLIVEGEKCADAAHELVGDALDVLTWPGGGKAVSKADFQPLAGRSVVVWPDCDAKRDTDDQVLPEAQQPGVKAAEAVAEVLVGLGCRVRIVKIPAPGTKPDGWDVADALEEGWTREQTRAFLKDNQREPACSAAPDPSRASASSDRGAWKAQLIRSNSGAPRDCRENLITILTMHPAWAGVLAFDEFGKRVAVRGPTPLGQAPGSTWREQDDIQLGMWLSQTCGLLVRSLDTIAQAVGYVARLSPFHPVRDWLVGLQWDEQPRLDTWAPRLLSAADTHYHRRVGELFVLNMIRRVLEPGCVMRSVMVLEGAQNKGKSRALHALASPWYSDTVFRVGDKDAYQLIQGVWLYEISELESFNRSEATAVKAFVSSTEDRFRAPYGRQPETHLRQVAFAATTNADEYLKDWSGNTRFWPLRIGERVELEQIAGEREQLFAEAQVRLKAGARSYPLQDEWEEHFEPEQQRRMVSHPWVDIVGEYLGSISADAVTVRELLQDALKFDTSRISPNGLEAQRVGQIMQSMGWRKRRSTAGTRPWQWVKAPATRKPASVEVDAEDASDLPL